MDIHLVSGRTQGLEPFDAFGQLPQSDRAFDPLVDLAVAADEEDPRLRLEAERRHLGPDALGGIVVVVDLHVKELDVITGLGLHPGQRDTGNGQTQSRAGASGGFPPA